MVDVIYVYADPYDDMVHLTKKELQELLDRAFKQGHNQGYAEARYYYTSPYITTTPAITYKQEPGYKPPYTITCTHAGDAVTIPYTNTYTGDATTIPYTYTYTGPCDATAETTGTKSSFSTYTTSCNNSIIFTSSEAEANYGIGTNMNN